jgi:hypothetical protein
VNEILQTVALSTEYGERLPQQLSVGSANVSR